MSSEFTPGIDTAPGVYEQNQPDLITQVQMKQSKCPGSSLRALRSQPLTSAGFIYLYLRVAGGPFTLHTDVSAAVIFQLRVTQLISFSRGTNYSEFETSEQTVGA